MTDQEPTHADQAPQDPPENDGKPARLTAADFQEEGYLLEVNRRFFHPLGLAAFVNVETNEIGIFDDRGDPEGWFFAELTSVDVGKVEHVAELEAERRPDREAALGYWIQPGDTVGDLRPERYR